MPAYFHLAEELTAVARHRDGMRIVRLPEGATVRVSEEHLSAERGLIEVVHEGVVLSVFAEDLRERAERASMASR